MSDIKKPLWAIANVSKFLDELAKMRGLDHDQINALHEGHEREAILYASDIHVIIDELDCVTAERDALKVDAERYRFLRAQKIDGEPGQPVIAMPNGMSSGYYLNEETADFAIDASISQSKGEK